MSKKKKKSVNNKNSGSPVSLVKDEVVDDVDEHIYMSKDDLAEYVLAQQKVIIAQMSVRLLQYETLEFQRSVEQRSNQLNSKLKAARDELQSFGENLKSLQGKLGKKYNVDFNKITYDDETGRITIHPDEDG